MKVIELITRCHAGDHTLPDEIVHMSTHYFKRDNCPMIYYEDIARTNLMSRLNSVISLDDDIYVCDNAPIDNKYDKLVAHIKNMADSANRVFKEHKLTPNCSYNMGYADAMGELQEYIDENLK